MTNGKPFSEFPKKGDNLARHFPDFRLFRTVTGVFASFDYIFSRNQFPVFFRKLNKSQIFWKPFPGKSRAICSHFQCFGICGGMIGKRGWICDFNLIIKSELKKKKRKKARALQKLSLSVCRHGYVTLDRNIDSLSVPKNVACEQGPVRRVWPRLDEQQPRRNQRRLKWPRGNRVGVRTHVHWDSIWIVKGICSSDQSSFLNCV